MMYLHTIIIAVHDPEYRSLHSHVLLSETENWRYVGGFVILCTVVACIFMKLSQQEFTEWKDHKCQLLKGRKLKK